jgi:hypothetical protein
MQVCFKVFFLLGSALHRVLFFLLCLCPSFLSNGGDYEGFIEKLSHLKSLVYLGFSRACPILASCTLKL